MKRVFCSHPGKSHASRVGLLCLAIVHLAGSAFAAPLDQPTPETLTEARRIVQEMIANQRGPYSGIRWFCDDGTIQAPVAFACRDHDGGRQHAAYSAARERLAELGWSVGTIFAAATVDELRNSQPRQARLRELPLEQYLVDIDNGWVLRRAQDYRGRVQIEDEVAAGSRLLLELMLDTQWSLDNFLLVRELARTIPHGDDSDLARDARRMAVELAELDSSAERWRIEIHNNPSVTTAARLREWGESSRDEAVVSAARALADTLDTLFGESGRRTRIASALLKLGTGPLGTSWRQSVNQALGQDDFSRIGGLCSAMATARSSLFAKLPPERRLAMIDALHELETDVQLSYRDMTSERLLSRAENLQISRSLLECAYASGLLSQTELDAITPSLVADTTMALADYRKTVVRLKRAPGWAIGTIRYTFAEALTRYTALDSRAARFSDDLLRGSPMWMLGDTLKSLSRDVDQLTGSVAEFAGEPVGGAVALNPGMATGPLRIFETLESLEGADIAATDIVVIPETIAELTPVAGILTLGEGNALSHVQLLARNFGIPNVAVDYDGIEMLRPLQDQLVRLIVGSEGSVILEIAEATGGEAADRAPAGVTVPVPDLGVRRLLTLDEIGRDMSGRIVGPKAANLGELNRLFPGRVAPAIAIPFGIYAEHLEMAGLSERIVRAFGDQREGSLTQAAFADELAAVRSSIAGLELSAEVRDALKNLMAEQFGIPGSYGVFVRSDTNVEDLPQFTGAGLNETIPNLVDPSAQVAAVPRVWSSVLSPRALAWRSSVLTNPEQIYASVLLMKSVPATKSGVLVTTNLADRSQPGLTASVAWGVGGAVAGEAAETVAILSDSMEILSEAKSPYQRQVSPTGGVIWEPAASGPVMTPAEIAQLQELAVDVAEKYVPVLDDNGQARPWDIEFGFVDGELTLFQIRPLVERGSSSSDAAIRARRPGSLRSSAGALQVALDQLPEG